jgi:hypothetical protein
MRTEIAVAVAAALGLDLVLVPGRAFHNGLDVGSGFRISNGRRVDGNVQVVRRHVDQIVVPLCREGNERRGNAGLETVADARRRRHDALYGAHV